MMATRRLLVASFLLIVIMGQQVFLPDAEADTMDKSAPSVDVSDDGSDLTGFDDDDQLDFGEEIGFTEIKVDLDEINVDDSTSTPITFGGFFKEEIDYSYAHEEPDYSKIKSTLNLNLDIRFSRNWQAKINWNGFYDYAYTHRGRDDFSDETLDVYESESEIRDLYLDGGITDWLRLKIGRQIIAWGQSDSEQITDLANPRDMRELGMVDLEDARVPVTATELSFLIGTVELNAVAIHEIRGNKRPTAGSEFDFLQDVRAQGIIIEDEEIPESNAENTEYLVRLFKVFNGGDFGLVWADIYDDAVHLDFEELVISNALPDPAQATAQLTLVPRHKRIQSWGFSANRVKGAWLFKTDIAKRSGVAVLRNDIDDQIAGAVISVASSSSASATFDQDSEAIKTWTEKDVIKGMIGFEYSGFSNITISLEGVGERIEAYEDNLSSDEVTGQIMLMMTHKAMNDALDTTVFWVHFTGENGDVYRLNVAYDLMDALTISGGFIAYEAAEKEATVYNFRNNDRVFAGIRYSF